MFARFHTGHHKAVTNFFFILPYIQVAVLRDCSIVLVSEISIGDIHINKGHCSSVLIICETGHSKL